MTPSSPATDAPPARYDDLRALVINRTLKRSPEKSNTQGLIDRCTAILDAQDVHVDVVRALDHDIATGVWPDMREHGWETDAWPELYRQVMAADILVLAGPIWLGDNSSVTKQVIERLYACSSLLNEAGQYAYHGHVGGCLITGNEDGVKHCAMNVLYSLQHLGYTIPPQADAGWIGEAGPCAEGPRRHPRLRQPAHRLGRRLPPRLREPRTPVTMPRETGGRPSGSAAAAWATVHNPRAVHRLGLPPQFRRASTRPPTC